MRSRHITRAILFVLGLAVGWLVFRVTQNLVVSVAVQFVLSGWPAVSTGLWLFNRDDHFGRAWACLFFSLAIAAWNSAASAVASILILASIFQKAQPPENEIAAILVSLLLAVALCLLLGYIAIAIAIVFSVRVWLHPDIRDDLVAEPELRATTNNDDQRLNRAFPIVAANVISPPCILATITMTLALIWNANAPNEALAWVSICMLFGGPLAAIPIYVWLSRRILARKPADCWPPRK